MKEYGFFRADGSFYSVDKRSNPDYPLERVEFRTPIPEQNKPFREWAEIFSRRQVERSAYNAPEHVEISIDAKRPILLIPFGDVHAGGADVDYDRFYKEVDASAKTSGTYVLTLGDITDSFFWGRETQDGAIASYKEQNEFMRSALKMFSDNKKLLAGWRGDHDGWAVAMGEDIYNRFVREFGAYFLDGPSYISLTVGNQLYKISGAHQHGGFSIYNKAHPALRLYRDSSEGADICITAHQHQKGYLTQATKRYGGESETVHYISIGAYKRSDRFLRKKGYSRLTDDMIGPQSILLWPDRKKIQVYESVESGLEALNKERI